MAERTSYYIIGDHPLAVTFVDEANDSGLIPSFAPFLTDTKPDHVLFRMVVDDAARWDSPHREIGQFDCGGCNHGVYRQEDGGYQFEVSDVKGILCARMQSNADFSQCTVALLGETWVQRNYGLNNALMMAYAFSSADKGTLLMHASVIRHQDKAYPMTAPSGTGKSTHTRLWYDHIPDCDLMNDDNPVIRVREGLATLYGSPWSGKTACYRNIQAPIGALVRIKQAPQNSIRLLSPLETFTQLLPAMSSMKWDKRVYNGVVDSISELMRLCSMYELSCLPDAAAAHLCHDTIVR